MKSVWKWLSGKKTHLSVIGAIATGLAGLVGGDISLYEFGLIVFGGAGMSSIRARLGDKP